MNKSLWPNNLVFLRTLKGENQTKTATALGLTRSTYAKYEKGINVPSIETAAKISTYFKIDLFEFVYTDLENVRNVRNTNINKSGKKVRNNVRNDVRNNEKLSLSTRVAFLKAEEYLENIGYVFDLETNDIAQQINFFIKNFDKYAGLASLRIPDLYDGIHFRFPISEDNMHPIIKPGDKVVVTYIPELATVVREGNIFIIVTKDDQIACNRVYKADKNYYELVSDNETYKPFKVALKDITAVLKVVEVHSRNLGSSNTKTKQRNK